MANDEEVWRWLTEVDDDSIMGRAWNELAVPKKVKVTTHKAKSGSSNRFIKWLRSRSKWYQPEPAVSAVAVEGTEARVSDFTDSVVKVLDPENPTPLDAGAIIALVSWGRSKEYGEMVEERRVVARELKARQKPRVRGE